MGDITPGLPIQNWKQLARLELELDPGAEFSRECAWTVPADAVKGAGTLRIDVRHMEKKDVLADAQARVTVR